MKKLLIIAAILSMAIPAMAQETIEVSVTIPREKYWEIVGKVSDFLGYQTHVLVNGREVGNPEGRIEYVQRILEQVVSDPGGSVFHVSIQRKNGGSP